MLVVSILLLGASCALGQTYEPTDEPSFEPTDAPSQWVPVNEPSFEPTDAPSQWVPVDEPTTAPQDASTCADTITNQHWIGDGECDVYGSYNTEICGYDGGDCCEDTCMGYNCGDAPFFCLDPSALEYVKTCMEQNPDWVGNGFCDYYKLNNPTCDYDGGDCCQSTCVGTACGQYGYDCKDPSSTDFVPVEAPTQRPDGQLCEVKINEWLGDQYCDLGEYNSGACDWDHGDCCQSTCEVGGADCSQALFFCMDPSASDYGKTCAEQNPNWVGNGLCDYYNLNNATCDYDGGDCCQSTCVGTACGQYGYNCVDPAACENTPAPCPTSAPATPVESPSSAPVDEPTNAPAASPSSGSDMPEAEFLCDLISKTNIAEFSDKWKCNGIIPDTAPCGGGRAAWPGLKCNDDGRVTELNIHKAIHSTDPDPNDVVATDQHPHPHKKVYGVLPRSIGTMQELVSLKLAGQDFYGHLPEEIGQLKHLQELTIHYNRFKGMLPKGIGLLPLKYVDVGMNRFDGHIPKTWKNLYMHKAFVNVYGNRLKGIEGWESKLINPVKKGKMPEPNY